VRLDHKKIKGRGVYPTPRPIKQSTKTQTAKISKAIVYNQGKNHVPVQGS